MKNNFNHEKTKTQRQLDKHGPGFGEIPVFVPADIEKSKEKGRNKKEEEKKVEKLFTLTSGGGADDLH